MLKRFWLNLERGFLLHVIRLFRIRSTSERVARGFAVGLIINFIPTFGFGVVASGFVARAVGGNTLAGLIGGALLTFFWPLLFYLNVWTGSFFHRPPILIDDPEDLTQKTMDALIWGKTFVTGMFINSAVVGLAAYLLLVFAYDRARPKVLAYFRRHAHDHQRRFGRPRNAVSAPS